MSDLPPLQVHLCWFAQPDRDSPTLKLARQLLGFLQQPADDDVVTLPGLEIPTEFGRDLEKLVANLVAGTEPATDARVVIVFLDDAAYAKGRAAIERARQRTSETYVGIVLDPRWLDEDLGAFVIIDATQLAGTTGEAKLETAVARTIVHALRIAAGEQNPGRPQIFISYERTDSQVLADRLSAHLTGAGFAPWLDDSPVPRGDALGQQLRAATCGVVVVIRSNNYSDRRWCALELLAAKRARVPIVTLLQLDGERLASAYGGNHRTLRWLEDHEWEVTVRCAQALLQAQFFRPRAAYLLNRANLADVTEVLTRQPELLDIVTLGDGRQVLFHPDPNLSDAEADVLRQARPEVRLATPRTLFGRVLLDKDPRPPLTGLVIAFSLSRSDSLPDVAEGAIGSGLTQELLLSTLDSITLATLDSGARIAFGGDFRDTGYTQKLADLHRMRRRLGRGAGAQLICYLDHGKRAGGRDPEFAPVEVTLPEAAETSPVRQTLWDAAMRDLMARQANARILLGGKTRPLAVAGDKGYFGAWSGILEEALRMLERGKALYVLGGYGGIAGTIADMLSGDVVPEVLRDATYANTDLPARTAAVKEASKDLVGFPRVLSNEDMANEILAKWRAFKSGDASAWANGLTADQNLALMKATDQNQITLAIFEGLSSLALAETTGALSLYFGDICTVPAIDGYAATVTPGVPPVGASAALDKKLGGRITAAVTRSAGGITLIEGGGRQLAGRVVLIAELRVPDTGTVQAATIRELTKNIVMEADHKGVQSLAIHPFGVTLGITVKDCANAIQAGFADAKSQVVHTLVLCELDRERYEGLHEALPSAVELHADGPQVALPDPGAVLHIDAVRGDAMVKVETTLYSTTNHDAVVPSFRAQVPRAEWDQLRERFTTYKDSVGIGIKLWTQVIRDDVETQLEKRRGRLVVLTNDDASGLPWELLNDGANDPLASTTMVVRQIKLFGACRPPQPPARASAKHKALVVINPTGDLPGAQREGEAVAAALKARADFEVVTRGTGTTASDLVALLASGAFEVLHYSGHAFFNEQQPEGSGLYMANETVVTGEMLASVTAPRFVFLSACESGRVRAAANKDAAPTKPAFSLAERFLRNGVAALVGTFFTVEDESAEEFSARVYQELAKRTPLGDAVHAARAELFGKQVADWGNFILYGDDAMVL